MSLSRLPMCADLINQNFEDYSLLDLGCRTMDLKPLLHSCKEYHGTDFIAAEGVFQCNLEEGLPQFESNSFDIVTALDVLEHLENSHKALDEALRVAKKAVFVSLPNMYYIKFRLNFLMGKGLSGKYAFPTRPIMDRHRWVLSFSEAVNFIQENTKKHEVSIHKIIPARGRMKMIAEPIETWLSENFPDTFSYGVLFMIRKQEK
ncbi:methionine biosynthesis protein MetW [Thalassospira profundimaris]|nr:methionine biosynthesis protein MetW [Thalassospira profundimaris]